MTRPDRWPDGRTPVLVSAHAGDLLTADAHAVLNYLERHQDVSVDEVAGQLAATRRVRRHRALIRAGNRDELADGLRAVAAGADHPLVARSAEGSAHSAEGATARVAFVFPGQGTQWPSMGAQAYRELEVYRTAADACAEAFAAAGAPSPVPYLTGDGDTFTETEIEGAQFTHAVALAQVWRSYGVLPDITVGHSLGEIGAAYIAGAVTLPDAVSVVIARAGVVDRLPGDHAVAVLGVDPDTAQQVVAATPGWLELAVVNAPSSVAVSGDRAAVSAAVARVRGQGRFAREITVGFPVHTSILEPLRDDLLHQLPDAEFADTPVQFIGGATGDVVPAGTPFGEYWYANLRTMVRFDHAFGAALRCGARIFVELSAHPQLLFAMGDLLGDTAATLVGSGRRDVPITEALSANLATAAVADPAYPWRNFVGRSRLAGFPNAPMRATPLWAFPEPLTPAPGLTIAQEVWQPVAGRPTAAAAAPVAVAVVDLGAPGELGERLRAAAAGHSGVTLTTPDAAELLIVAAAHTADAADADTTVAVVTALVDAGALRYPAAAGLRCRDVWLVTVGGEAVRPGEPVAMTAAALAAAHRSLGLEHPELGFHHLDVSAETSVDTALIDTLLSGAGELALRGTGTGSVLHRRTVRDAAAAPPWPLDSGVLDDVVITGGAGSIGLRYARHLAERGARRIVLLSRRAVDPAVLTGLAASSGVEVLSVPCDITDRAALAEAAGRYAGDGASLLIHAAGAATFAGGDRIDTAAAGNTFAAKVIGLANVAQLWPLRTDARIVLCSSVSGLWGGRGHAVYSAANRMLDVMAQRLREDGRRTVAIRWGLWQSDGSGIVDETETARIERSGLRPMAPEQAIEASLCDYGTDPLVLSADPHRIRMFFDAAEPVRTRTAPAPAAEAVDTAGAVRAELAAVLGLAEPGDIDLGASLFDLGVDSLLALDLRKRFRRVIGRTVPLATLLGGITGSELVAELDEKVDTQRD